VATVVKADADIVLMASKKKITISWSGGKDSAFALYKILKSGEFEIVNLHTVINEETERVGMHGVHESLIERQASAIGLPLTKLYLASSESHDDYIRLMVDFYAQCANENIHAVVFGDIFLEDLKLFREALLTAAGLQGIYPLWKLDTEMMIRDFTASGFKTLICAANAKYFSERAMGKTIGDDFASSLLPAVDPCGENGEFHTFVYDGPVFKNPVAFQMGEVVQKKYSYQVLNDQGLPEQAETSFWFQDLVLS
jgi:uncharacterized protein (TIGR00290 family)